MELLTLAVTGVGNDAWIRVSSWLGPALTGGMGCGVTGRRWWQGGVGRRRRQS
jgi:hypothetical protein